MPPRPLKPRTALAAAVLLGALSGAPAARADDPPAAPGGGDPGQTYDPRDLNQDGTVTRKEKRQYRRMLRGTGAGGAAPAATPDAAAASDAAATGASASHSAAAMKSASGAAAALKDSLPSADSGAMGSGGGARAAASSGAAAASAATAGPARAGPGPATTAGATGDPANPRSASDFVLAARSGYAPAFAAAGLKLSADGRGIVRLDGSPATADDLARLRAGIAAMPAALARRPDFFSRVSPEHYADLKQGYRTEPGPASPVYKHVGMTDAERDFVHTQSCSKLSDACNASVEKPSYKKGDLVAPEDLDRMWSSLQKELDADASADQATSDLKRPSSARAADAAASSDGAADAGPRADAPDASAVHGPPGAAATPIAAAVAATTRFWKTTRSALGWGGTDGPRGQGAAWPWAAALAAALAFGIWNVRRRG